MSSQFKLYHHVDESEKYCNKTEAEKEELRLAIVKMALVRGIKPTAHYL